MSIWEEFAMESRIREVLKAARYDKRHHFGRPFLTAYQLAIAFDKAHRDYRKRLGERKQAFSGDRGLIRSL